MLSTNVIIVHRDSTKGGSFCAEPLLRLSATLRVSTGLSRQPTLNPFIDGPSRTRQGSKYSDTHTPMCMHADSIRS